MGGPESWVRINFPAKAIDADIKKCLEVDYGVHIKDGEPQQTDDIEVDDGIFSMHDSSVIDAEFTELEQLLVEKNVPFDRENGMDWQISPCLRIFRPGEPSFDHYFYLDGDGAQVVKVDEMRRRLADPFLLKMYLDENFPTYPSLQDWVKEVPMCETKNQKRAEMPLDNDGRATLAARALEHYPDLGCLEDTIVDLIADLMHLAQQQSLSPYAVINGGISRYEGEANHG